jgi:hypothetical protein
MAVLRLWLNFCITFACLHYLIFHLQLFRSFIDSSLEELTLKYLPPLSLHFSLPCDYPSDSSPTYTLFCQWLQNSKVRNDLNNDFQDDAKSSVVFRN